MTNLQRVVRGFAGRVKQSPVRVFSTDGDLETSSPIAVICGPPVLGLIRPIFGAELQRPPG